MRDTAVARLDARRRRRPTVLGMSVGVGPNAVGLLVGAVAWEVVGRIWNVAFLPPLSAVFARLWQMTVQGRIVENFLGTLGDFAIGFAISAAAGVGLGMLMGAYRRVEMALDIYVMALLTAPSLVFAPIFFAIFGLGRASIVGVVIVYSTWIMITTTATAIRTVPIELVEMGRSYCATERELFMKIILPAASPLIFTGLRLGVGRAIKGAINGEMFISIVGLGAVVEAAGHRMDAAAVFGVTLLIVVAAMLAIKVVQVIDARMTAWLPSTSRQT